MGEESKNDSGLKKIDEKKHLETYKVVIQLLNNEVNLNWQRLYNFLLANTILITAWVLIFTQGRGLAKELSSAKELLVGISFLGFILSIFGASATATGNAYHGYWLLWLNFLEKENELVHNVFGKMESFIKYKSVNIKSQDEKVNDQCCCCSKLLTPHINYKLYTIQMPRIPAVRVMTYFALMAVLFIVIYLLLLIYSFCLLFSWGININIGSG